MSTRSALCLATLTSLWSLNACASTRDNVPATSLGQLLRDNGWDAVAITESFEPGDIVVVQQERAGIRIGILSYRILAFRDNPVDINKAQPVGDFSSARSLEGREFVDVNIGQEANLNLSGARSYHAVIQVGNMTIDSLRSEDVVQQYQRNERGDGVYREATVRSIREARAGGQRVSFVTSVLRGDLVASFVDARGHSMALDARAKALLLSTGWRQLEGSESEYSAKNCIIGAELRDRLIPNTLVSSQ